MESNQPVLLEFYAFFNDLLSGEKAMKGSVEKLIKFRSHEIRNFKKVYSQVQKFQEFLKAYTSKGIEICQSYSYLFLQN